MQNPMDENFEYALQELKAVREELESIHDDLRYELFDFHEDLEAFQYEHQELQQGDEEQLKLWKELPFHEDLRQELREGLEELLERHEKLQKHDQALEELEEWNERIIRHLRQDLRRELQALDRALEAFDDAGLTEN